MTVECNSGTLGYFMKQHVPGTVEIETFGDGSNREGSLLNPSYDFY